MYNNANVLLFSPRPYCHQSNKSSVGAASFQSAAGVHKTLMIDLPYEHTKTPTPFDIEERS